MARAHRAAGARQLCLEQTATRGLLAMVARARLAVAVAGAEGQLKLVVERGEQSPPSSQVTLVLPADLVRLSVRLRVRVRARVRVKG